MDITDADRNVRDAAAHPLLSSAPNAGDDTGVTLLAAQSLETTCRPAAGGGGGSGGEGDASWERCVWQISNDIDDGAGGGFRRRSARARRETSLDTALAGCSTAP